MRILPFTAIAACFAMLLPHGALNAQDAAIDCAFDAISKEDRFELVRKLEDGSLGTIAPGGDAEARLIDSVDECADGFEWEGEKRYAFFEYSLSRNLADALRANLLEIGFPIAKLERAWDVEWPQGAPDPMTLSDERMAELQKLLIEQGSPADSLPIVRTLTSYLQVHRSGAAAYRTIIQ